MVADSCDDDTAAIADRAGAHVVEVRERNVGRVRAAGCRVAMATGSAGVWLACTDADSTVPPNWLTRHLEYAADGADMVTGVIAVAEWQRWSPQLRAQYRAYYAQAIRAGRPRVYGCNLGISATAYQAVRGFPPLFVGEDRGLLTAARRAGLTIAHATDLVVTTSSRRRARGTGGGFRYFLA